ncbi:START domain containing 14 [Triplophysa dalaica]|uniref:START domain containing 14 n=1 Tax=Triplophysa dalaica TaxID=1582913 RepID=UPI0024DFBD2C|nr:START domain containing 14 [Triplophysa dalaica]XP_056624987.1 START domain containing 14 [Triplophysa dalaica]
MSRGSGIIPDESMFNEFKRQCLSTENWLSKYDKNGMEVWVEVAPVSSQGNKGNNSKIHKIKCRITIDDVSAATMYDVLHDSLYRKTWDPTMLESFDIARLGANSDVGYFSWMCPKPLKNRDVVTLRSWQASEDEYVIFNFSVKHPNYPPRKDLVRAVSLLTGYLIKPTGKNSCVFTYLSQADPRGSLPRWVVNKASQVLAPKVLRSVYMAGQKYPAWKAEHNPDYKPWLYPIQSELAMMDPAKLSIQRGDSLENVDESTSRDTQENEDSS